MGKMKTKILIIVENLPVPFDTRVWKEALALQNNGYEVFVICPQGKNFEKKHECIKGVNIFRHPMPQEGHKTNGYLVEYAAAFFWEFFLSWKIFLKHDFKVIQGCNPPDNIFMIALMFKIFGVKYIFDHHDANPELFLAKFGHKNILYYSQVLLEKMTFRFSDAIMSTNETYKKIAITRGRKSPEDVFVVRNGPDSEKFKPVNPLPELKHGKKFLVGYVGTISVQEGLDILLEVALLIKKTGRRDIHFTCVGGGPGLKEVEEMKSQMEIDDMFNFTGRIPDKELLEILSTADVCVNPDSPNGMNDISTMIKIMEYMALSKPIVQFDLKEGRYSAQDAALYAQNNNIKDFAEKILWLVDHPEERKTMGISGRKRVEEKLAWKYSIPGLLAAYRRVGAQI
ncbi:MAG: glycosyltransferase family 4 protein [Deltaproteobacteria bacterium]|nr:glycosyltransferase family 4 protein [Deltaproteobacteria bacterium]